MAIEFAYRYRAEFQFVFWFRAISREQLVRDYAEISKYLVNDSRTGKEPFVAAHVVKTWFETNEDGNWLLIYDNVENISQIHDLVPSGQGGSILFTTQDRNAIGTISDEVFDILPMDRLVAQNFLLRAIRRVRVATLFEKEQAMRCLGIFP